MTRPTWDEMMSYLEQQKTCIVYGDCWTISNLHSYLEKYKNMISGHDPKDRGTNLHCLRLKSSLHRTYISFQNGNTKPIASDN